jgi:hypothetical protein
MNDNFNGISIHYLDFDIYSKTIGFFYHDKERIGSMFGFVLSIIYVVITLFLFIFFTITTINRSDIRVHDSVLYQKEAPEMTINSNFFYFAFGVENHLTGYTRFIDETIYYPEVIYIKKIKEGSAYKIIEERPLAIERCDADKFGKEYQNLLVKGELDNSYCIKNFNVSLVGNFKYDKLSYIQINIYPCINSTKNRYNCRPKEEINSFLSGTFFSILAKDIGLEPTNYSYPVIPQFQDIYVSMDKSYFRDLAVFFGITEIQTDVGLFYEKIKKERYLNYIKSTQGFYYQDEKNYYNGSSMCEIQIRMNDDIRIQKRTYRKMSDAFAITGGYMQLISTIFSIIIFLANKIDIEIQIVNSLFNFYPKKMKLSLRHKLQQICVDSPDMYNKYYSFPKMKNTNTNASYRINNSIMDKNKSKRSSLLNINKSNSLINSRKGNTFVNINRNNVISFKGNNENLSQSNNKKSRNNLINGKSSECINKDIINKIDKESSMNESYINNKSKIAFLTFGNTPNKKYSLFNKNLVIKKKDSIRLNDTQRTEYFKKKIEFNSFYYFCLSKFKNNKEDNDLIKLFDLATSFYKQRMDIIYLFHIFLLIERTVGRKKDTIVNDEDMYFVLNDNQYI